MMTVYRKPLVGAHVMNWCWFVNSTQTHFTGLVVRLRRASALNVAQNYAAASTVLFSRQLRIGEYYSSS
jgi:hypothetical protein